MDVGQLLDISEARFFHKTAIIFNHRRYTYGQVKDRVQRLMTGLARLGVKKGDRMSTLMWNSAEMMEINLAAMRLGAVFAPLNYRFKGHELGYVVENARPKVLIADDRCQDLAGNMASSMDAARSMISTAGKQGKMFQSYEALINENEPFEGAIDVKPQDPCQLLYTSGTTARPKGVVLSHENVIWNAFNMIHARHDRPDDVSLIVGPLFHAAALNSHYIPRMALGATMIIMDKFEPELMMNLIQREGVTIVPGNPTLFIMLLEFCASKQLNTSTVTTPDVRVG